ncbi:MAG: sigma-70 family RNA polymerase sigma factor [Verrucomicrobiae bacterium]|nr:sigma-70 family RNA polymerase sigma factor [Verrucomicrobiae bacterium]
MTTALSQLDDVALVERLKARDKEALAELVRRHGSKIYGVALQITRDQHEAEEVVQDALVNIWNKIEFFEGRSALTSWLYRVTANAALMRLRRNKKFEQNVSLDATREEDELPVIELPDTKSVPTRALTQTELGERMRAAIDALAEPYRTTVLLADVEEMSMEEIAEAMGATVPAVKSRLHRARLALRKALLPYLKGRV